MYSSWVDAGELVGRAIGSVIMNTGRRDCWRPLMLSFAV